MDDLIRRQDAIEIIQNMYPGMPRVPWLRKDWQERYDPYIRTEKAIRELPNIAVGRESFEKMRPIEPERQKGKWTLHPDGTGDCDQCGVRQVAIWDFDNQQSFCGHCGADMRERRTDERMDV